MGTGAGTSGWKQTTPTGVVAGDPPTIYDLVAGPEASWSNGMRHQGGWLLWDGSCQSCRCVGQGGLTEQQSREAFRILCDHWAIYRGTPVRLWFDSQPADIFGLTARPSAETADQICDQIAACMASPEFKPRALYDKFKIEVLPVAQLVAEDRLEDDEAIDIMHELVVSNPRRAFKL